MGNWDILFPNTSHPVHTGSVSICVGTASEQCGLEPDGGDRAVVCKDDGATVLVLRMG